MILGYTNEVALCSPVCLFGSVVVADKPPSLLSGHVPIRYVHTRTLYSTTNVRRYVSCMLFGNLGVNADVVFVYFSVVVVVLVYFSVVVAVFVVFHGRDINQCRVRFFITFTMVSRAVASVNINCRRLRTVLLRSSLSLDTNTIVAVVYCHWYISVVTDTDSFSCQPVIAVGCNVTALVFCHSRVRRSRSSSRHPTSKVLVAGAMLLGCNLPIFKCHRQRD